MRNPKLALKSLHLIMVKVKPMNWKTSYGCISGKLQSWLKKIVNVLKTPSSASNSASGCNFE